jgi:hypothetical protein
LGVVEAIVNTTEGAAANMGENDTTVPAVERTADPLIILPLLKVDPTKYPILGSMPTVADGVRVNPTVPATCNRLSRTALFNKAAVLAPIGSFPDGLDCPFIPIAREPPVQSLHTPRAEAPAWLGIPISGFPDVGRVYTMRLLA